MKTAMLCALIAVLVGVPGAGAAQDAGATQQAKGLAERVTILENLVAEQANEIADLRSALDAERAARQSITFDLQGNDVDEGTARLALSNEIDVILGAFVAQGIAIPNVTEARIGSDEAAAIGSLRTIVSAQDLFRSGDLDHNGILDYAASLNDLSAHNLIDTQLGTGTKQGYNFAIASASQSAFTATACPVTPGVTGNRSFFVDQTSVIRFSSTCPAGPADPPGPTLITSPKGTAAQWSGSNKTARPANRRPSAADLGGHAASGDA